MNIIETCGHSSGLFFLNQRILVAGYTGSMGHWPVWWAISSAEKRSLISTASTSARLSIHT